MKRSFLLVSAFILNVLATMALAQISVSITIKEVPSSHRDEQVFITGNFASWQPGNELYALTKQNGLLHINLKLSAGTYEYKFTRGSWQKGESSSAGADVENRVIKLDRDTAIEISIGGWKDDFSTPGLPRPSTASKQVRILENKFFIPQLNRARRIWIYLPADYDWSTKRYPVIYMHDGQNLFEDSTSFSGEWGVDEAIDSLIKKGRRAAIIVGIDNGPKRMNEYNPYDFDQSGKGEGDQYIDFIATTIKPYIDKKFRTLSNKENTFIAGSSMGGLISFYAILKYPGVFGGAGVFSPAFWTAKGLNNFIEKKAGKVKGKVWFYAGGNEGKSMLPDMRLVQQIFKARSFAKTAEVIDMDARHNESAWRKYFPDFYLWILK